MSSATDQLERAAARPSAERRAIGHPTDDELLLAVRQGDLEAYAELYRRHHEAARRFARSLVGADLADDVVAESFAKMLGALRRGRGPTETPIRYLMVVVRTTAISLARRRTRDQQVVQDPTVTDGADQQLALMDDDKLVVALRSLPERWRQVIVWAELDELSTAEIAERLSLSSPAVAALAYRARKGLRQAYLAELAGADEG